MVKMQLMTWPCPLCETPIEFETVDIGVGEQPVSPAECPNCGWYQGYPEDLDDLDARTETWEE